MKKIQDKRKKIWNRYRDNILKFKTDKFYLIKPIKKCFSAYHLLVIIFKSLKKSNEFKNVMQRNGIAATFHYVPLHKSKMGKKFCKYRLPITEKIYNRVVRLPLFSDIKEKEFKKISYVLNNFVNK